MKKIFKKTQENDEAASEIETLKENVIQTGMPGHVEEIALKEEVMLVLYQGE